MQGNSGQGNWLGTSDNTDLILKANGQERLRLQAEGGIKASGLLQADRMKILGLTELDSVRSVHIRANRISSQNPGDSLIFFGDSSFVIDHTNNHIYADNHGSPRDLTIQSRPGPIETPNSNNTLINPLTGKVGIGTTSPAEKLHVVGDVQITGSKLHVSSTGNVGVGNSSPTDKLHVTGNIRITGSRLHVNSSGNIGIGTSSPQARLDVRNTSSGNAFRVLSDGTVIAGQLTGSGSTARVHFGDSNHYIGSKWGVGVSIGTFGAADVITIHESSGKVTIGPDYITAGPHTDFRLCVDGKIAAKEVVVTTDDNYWPDYVFGDDYKLTPLEEVKTFVQEHRHLPGIPSSEEIATAGGVELKEMNILLLKEIEHLYLQLFELKAEMQQLKQKP